MSGVSLGLALAAGVGALVFFFASEGPTATVNAPLHFLVGGLCLAASITALVLGIMAVSRGGGGLAVGGIVCSGLAILPSGLVAITPFFAY